MLKGNVYTLQDQVIEYNCFGISHSQYDGLHSIRCVFTKEWQLSINLSSGDKFYHLIEDFRERHNHQTLLRSPKMRAMAVAI